MIRFTAESAIIHIKEYLSPEETQRLVDGLLKRSRELLGRREQIRHGANIGFPEEKDDLCHYLECCSFHYWNMAVFLSMNLGEEKTKEVMGEMPAVVVNLTELYG